MSTSHAEPREPASRLREIGESIVVSTAEVLRAWRDLSEEEPWLGLPEEYRLNHLPEAIAALVDAALLRPEEHEAHRANVFASAQHGEDRRAQGFPEHLILREHHHLRRALRRFVEGRHGDSLHAFEAIARLDVAATVSTTAALRASHRERYEERGEWPATLEELAARQVHGRATEAP